MKRYGKVLALILATILIAAAPAFAEERLDKPLSQVLSDLRLERHVAGGGDPEETPEATLDNSYGLVIYASGDGGIDTVACDREGKPILTGMSARGIATRLNIAVQPITGVAASSWDGPEWMDTPWWREGFSADGLKAVAGSNPNSDIVTVHDGTVFFRDSNGCLSFVAPDGTTGVVDGTDAYYITVAPDGKVWFRDWANHQNLACYDPSAPEGNRLIHINGTRAQGIVIPPDGKVWFQDTSIAAGGKLACYDPSAPEGNRLIHINGTRAESGTIILSPDGKVWFRDSNHSNNLACYDPATEALTHVPGTTVANTAIGPDGKVWFRDASHSGNLACYDPATEALTHVPGTEAYNTTVAPDGKVWFRDADNSNNLACYDPAVGGQLTYIPGTDVEYGNKIIVDSDGKVWFQDCGHLNNLACYDPAAAGTLTYIEGTYASCLAIDIEDNIWFRDRNNSDALTVYSPYMDTTLGQD